MPGDFASCIIGQLMTNSGWGMVMVMKAQIQQARGCKMREFVLMRLESTELTVPNCGRGKKSGKLMLGYIHTHTCPYLNSYPCLQKLREQMERLA